MITTSTSKQGFTPNLTEPTGSLGSPKSIYLIGSLRNPEIPKLAKLLRAKGHDVFDDWFAAGPEADDYWQKYVSDKGLTYEEALRDYAAQHVFNFDKFHLDRCDKVVLVLPAGKSGHLEAGYAAAAGKLEIVLAGPVERYDVMYAFANKVHMDWESLLNDY